MKEMACERKWDEVRQMKNYLLTKGKTYYVRVRSYKTVSGTKYYSAWSSKKSVKISK